MKRNSRKGFTLLELLLVVIIVGILASVALPRFRNAADQSRESEASRMIDALTLAEIAYFQESNKFTGNAADLMVTVPAMAGWNVPTLTVTTANPSATPPTQDSVSITITSNHGHAVPGNHQVVATIDSDGKKTITWTRP